MNTKTRQLSYDVIRTFAIVLVTFNHALNRSFSNYTDQFLDFEKDSYGANIFKAAITVLSHVGVPLFLMLTGCLILTKSFETAEQRDRFFKRNWLRIVITTEIWLAISFWIIYFFSPYTGLRNYSLPKLILNFILNQFFIETETFESMWYMAMIIPVYTLLPMIALYIQHGNGKTLIIPCSILFVSSILIPFTNSVFSLTGINHYLDFGISSLNLFSMYLLYILLGTYFTRHNEKKYSTGVLFLIWLLIFAGATAFQLFAYKSPQDYLMDQDSVPVFALSAATFLLLRNLADKAQSFRQFFTYTSKISFGTYFIHIVIMELMNWNIPFTGWNPVLKFCALVAASMLGSYIIIQLCSKIKFVKKYFFLIKE